jgi:two-component system, NarL family, invasion response regulator UvrY
MHVLLVDDHPIVRRGVVEILRDAFPGVSSCQVDNAAGLMQTIVESRFDLVLLDLSLPDRHGLDCLRTIKRTQAQTPVLILSMHEERAFALRALQAGASGYVNKDNAPEELIAAIHRVLHGRRYISAELADSLAGRAVGEEQALHVALSPREFRVLRLLATGRAINEIAEDLHLSAKTVSTYRARLLEKLHLGTNAELVRYCLGHQLIQ